MKYEISKNEIEVIQNIILKIKHKCTFSYIGMFFGLVIASFALLYFMGNADLVAGSFSLAVIGLALFALNLLSLIQRIDRIKALNKDLEKVIEIYESQETF